MRERCSLGGWANMRNTWVRSGYTVLSRLVWRVTCWVSGSPSAFQVSGVDSLTVSTFHNREKKSPLMERWPRWTKLYIVLGFPGGSVLKNSLASAGDTRNKSSILGSRRSPGEGNDKPLHYSCLEKSMGRGAWGATVPAVTKSRT